MSAREFEGLTAVVTGAGSGIGLATATLLHERCSTFYGLDFNKCEIEATGVATWIECEVSDTPSV